MPNHRSRNRRRNDRRQNMRSNLRSNTVGMTGAPVSVSQDLQQYTRFSNNGREGLTMHVCAAICNLARISISTGSGNAGMIFPTGAPAVSAQLNLTDPAILNLSGTKILEEYISPVFDLVGSAFARYRFRKLCFHYEPQAAATTTERMVFAFAADPVHPLLWNGTTPTEQDLLALSDSVAFAPWKSWSMDVTAAVNKNKQMLYTFSDPSTTVAEFSERFSDVGVISCVTSSSSSTSTSCGVLYMEAVVDMEEFCPISLTEPVSTLKLGSKKKFIRLCHGKQYSAPKAESSKDAVIQNERVSSDHREEAEKPCLHENTEEVMTSTGLKYSVCHDCKRILFG